MTDPIADLLTRIRNALHAKHQSVRIPASKMKMAISDVLAKRQFIKAWSLKESAPQSEIEVELRYLRSGEPAIRGLKRVSKPGCRIYSRSQDIKSVLAGRGVALFSTPNGVLSGEDATKQGVGGEFLCEVW